MKRYIIFLCICVVSIHTHAQEQEIEKKDSLAEVMEEVIIVAKSRLNNYNQGKSLSSIDEYLDQSGQVSMIKRGNYAWEPSLNNMVSDRLNVTIDGMQIYGACTDKMDPVTSYVDVSNLEKVVINSGQDGVENANCVGGAIDMKLQSTTYDASGWKGSIDLGYETNGHYTSSGLELSFAGKNIYGSMDAIYRKSDNYTAGGSQEISYSQFQKTNTSFRLGYKMTEKNSVEGLLIYDEAVDVGYTALPMDVSLAKATIGSLSHIFESKENVLKKWETKIYANTITHIMDDSKRPFVPIRMDMPGWSDTYGFYSKVQLHKGHHHIHININGNYNRSIAEMTMFPNDPIENEMFMYTWPDVKTQVGGLYVKDKIEINPNSAITFSSRIGRHQNRIDNLVGLQSLQIYYPTMEAENHRYLKSFSTKYQLEKKNISYALGVGYGERAPSISEAYGFYLFNSFDNYDYIGNPFLANEKSMESNVQIKYRRKKTLLELRGAYFYIQDYIIGRMDPSLVSMTIGADGVRVYGAIPSATIVSSALKMNNEFNDHFKMATSFGYNYGVGDEGQSLPLIRPISYQVEWVYDHNRFNAVVRFHGDGVQNQYSMDFGEDKTPAYNVLDAFIGQKWLVKDNVIVLKLGVDNILDKRYSTYADWNNIYRQGRNYFVNISYLIL